MADGGGYLVAFDGTYYTYKEAGGGGDIVAVSGGYLVAGGGV